PQRRARPGTGAVRSDGEPCPVFNEGALSLFQDAYNPGADAAITPRPGAGPNAVQKVLALRPQGLGQGNVRYHDAPVAIGQPILAQAVRLEGPLNPFVVDADLLGLLNVVVDDHLLAPDDRHPAHLTGVQPAHVDVSDHVVREAELDVRHVVNARGHVRAARALIASGSRCSTYSRMERSC